MKLKLICAAMFALGLSAAADTFAGDGAGKGADDKFAKMDTNGDGKISSSEHSSGARTMFQSMDTNKDGSVTAAEMDAAHAGKKSGDMKRDGMKMSSADKIKKMDSNGDGRLSASEHEAGSRDMFAKSDANKDGSITAEEMKAAHQKDMTAKK
jgi:Ca2+-binding EF-hand superfamily protein